MKNWKRNAVVATVLVFVCAGIYLNWSYNQKQAAADLTDTLDADKVMGDSSLVLSSDGTDDLVATAGEDAGTASDYFANVRLSRQEARDSAVKTLQEAMSYEDGGDTSEASTELNSIVSDALEESRIESLVIAKGYEDCVAYINDDNISVAVSAPADGLQDTDVALIADIVTSQTDYTLPQIHVVEVK